ncbi:uncharacterized protein LOC129892185 [Solanum dulcamara]|uniref:uncharacterized protein LOC129892185 n=1 Tax=Solanum dulcamara TaxID=45834 RepID=UPI002484F8D3|nr:uncharacterized protein LOC129892185 [Solanum dulcamara]
MMNVSILLRNSGIWESAVSYTRYKRDGIVIAKSISYVNIKDTIAAELEITEMRKKFEIRYIMEGNSSLLLIRNDMGIRLYIEVKRSKPVISMYPLCIDTSDKINEKIPCFDGSSGEIVCLVGSDKDTQALIIVESKLGDSYCIPELKITNYITDSNNINVKEKQLYKNKDTLIYVITKYKVEHNFNFKIKRSDVKRKNSDVFKVRYFNSERTCPLRGMMLTKVQATVGFVSVVTTPKLVNHKQIHMPKDVIEDFKIVYEIDISYQQAWCAKERALEMIRGMHKSDKNEFMYLFISLRQFMRGFDFYKLVVIVDGAYLSATYNDTFLSASTLDGVVPSSKFIFSVYETGRRYIVCLEKKICNCGRIQIEEMSCSHAIAILKSKNITDIHPYCSDYYKPESLASTYEVSMILMPDKDDWLVPDNVLDEMIFPPRFKRMPERPRKSRRKNSDEKLKSNTN